MKIKIAAIISATLLTHCSPLFKPRREVIVEKETVTVIQVEPCTTAPHPDSIGYFLMCKDQEPVLIEHGSQGLPGESSSIELITPCPEIVAPDEHPETLVCINSSSLFAAYDNGKKGTVRLVQLIEGTKYQTTDGRSCTFVVGPSCSLEY